MAKISIYDWWWVGQVGLVGSLQLDDFDWQEEPPDFIPQRQEQYSNIKYTGNGFIPDDFIEFHSTQAEDWTSHAVKRMSSRGHIMYEFCTSEVVYLFSWE